MTKILLDTNMLILSVKETFPLEREIAAWIPRPDIMVPSSVLRELEKLSRRGLPHARGALKFAAKFDVLPTDLDGDPAMETLGKELGAWVVTMDGELKERLLNAGVGVLFPTGQTHLGASHAPL